MKNPWIVPVAALAVGAIGGFLSGKGGDPRGASPAAGETASRGKVSARRVANAAEDSKKASRVKSLSDAMATPGQSARVKALLDFYAGLTPEQLEEESKKLENLPMSERIMASILLFGRWAEVDPMTAMSHAGGMGMAGMFVRPTILQSWASVDPENAAKYYAENPREFAMMGAGPGGGQNGSSLIASEWAKQDPQSALAWASSLKDGEKAQAMTSVVREVALTDPKKAAELAASIDPAQRGQANDTIAKSWGASNFSEAEIWVKSLPADQQAAAMSSAISGLSQENPQLAKTKVDAMPAGAERDRATEALLGNLSNQNPADALVYWDSLKSQEVKENTVRDVIGNLTVKDNAKALEFILSEGPGKIQDNAISIYVMNDNNSDPKDLMAIAETVTDDGDRARSMGITYNRWRREDPESAKRYIQQSTAIPENTKERLLSGRGFGGGGWRGFR